MALLGRYRHDLLRWRCEQTGHTFRTIAGLAGIGRSTAWEIINGKTDPTASSLIAICTAMRIDPKYMLDFNLTDFKSAIVDVNATYRIPGDYDDRVD